MGEPDAFFELALRGEFGSTGDENDALVLMELLACGVDLPLESGGVSLFEHPRVGSSELDRAHRAGQKGVLTFKGGAQGGLPLTANAAGELEFTVHRVRHFAAILPGEDLARAAD